jgi:enoyl-CoA hydratase/carnithine racemase
MTRWRHVIVEKKGRVGRIILNRPKVRNPLDRVTAEEILAAMQQHLADDRVVVLEITGAGDAFCGGGDINEMKLFPDMSADDAAEWATPIIDAHQLMLRAEKPVIAAVNGAAVAGGFGLAGMCDILLATRNASFGATEVKVGIFPMIIVAHLARALPRKRLLEMMMTGEHMGAEEARELGFVSKVVDTREEMDELVARYAKTFERVSPTAIMMGRRAFNIIAEMPADAALRASQFFNLRFTMGEDFREGAAAFLGKRRPKWRKLK